MKFGRVTGKIFGETITLHQINKTEARERFDSGHKVYVNPCNMQVFNAWNTLTYVVKCEIVNDFDAFYNVYKHMNCNTTDIGRYPVFFKQIK